VPEKEFQQDFAKVPLLVQNAKEAKKVQCNDEHEDDHNNLIVVTISSLLTIEC
jgi:hypothetical protein